jgi:proline racemase
MALRGNPRQRSMGCVNRATQRRRGKHLVDVSLQVPPSQPDEQLACVQVARPSSEMKCGAPRLTNKSTKFQRGLIRLQQNVKLREETASNQAAADWTVIATWAS